MNLLAQNLPAFVILAMYAAAAAVALAAMWALRAATTAFLRRKAPAAPAARAAAHDRVRLGAGELADWAHITAAILTAAEIARLRAQVAELEDRRRALGDDQGVP